MLSLSVAFTQPTFPRILGLLVGIVLGHGRRTVLVALWWAEPWVAGHYSTYHRVFSRARWSLWPLGRILASAALALGPKGPVLIAVDDTVEQHKGPKVYGKGKHHDGVRSTHSMTVWRWGLRWVVLSVLVPIGGSARPWALPVLVALYRPREINEAEGRRHKTPIQLCWGLMVRLIRWFPQRKFVLVGDGGYASHELASRCQRWAKRCVLISRFHGDAALYGLAPKPKGRGRPRKKGPKQATPADQVQQTKKLRRLKVRWYSGRQRRVAVVQGRGYWYRSGGALVALRWVFVRDQTGKRREEYYFTTDPKLHVRKLIEWYTWRWSIETTFQELRAHLGLESARGWCRNTVLRWSPCQFGLFTIISLIYHAHQQKHGPALRTRAGYCKLQPTFSDAMTTVRRLFWRETVFAHPRFAKTARKIPRRFRERLLDYLSSPL